jgi:glutamate formiminotransferase / 5-formyltetrahydrofolate cyclo-ligase
VQLAEPASIADARGVAAAIREGGERGIPGVRAIAIQLRSGAAQVSMNVEQPLLIPLAEVLARIRRLAPIASAELVGLAPSAAFEGFPEDVPMPGFDASHQLLENALRS